MGSSTGIEISNWKVESSTGSGSEVVNVRRAKWEQCERSALCPTCSSGAQWMITEFPWAGALQESSNTRSCLPPHLSPTGELQDDKQHCPHLLLSLHSWSGHGNVGVPATGKQYTQMGRKCVISDSCCFEPFHYVACTAVSSITAWRNNWPYEGNLAFIPESVHQGPDFCKCAYLPPFCKGTDKEEPEMHLEMCVHWITNYSRICRDCHVLQLVNWLLVSEALPSNNSRWQRRKTVAFTVKSVENRAKFWPGSHGGTSPAKCHSLTHTAVSPWQPSLITG